MNARLAVAAALAAALATLPIAGCGSPRRSEALGNAFVPLSPVVAHGERLFMANCHPCHPGGAAGLGPAINNKPLPAFVIRTQVRLGVGAMPTFSPADLPAEDLDAVIAYLAARRVQ